MKTKKEKILWLSRHDMTTQQKASAQQTVFAPIEVIKVNLTWQASKSEYDDKFFNRALLDDLLAEHRDCVAVFGVFPPVAREVISDYHTSKPFYESVSIQNPDYRKTTEDTCPFIHARWSKLK